MSLYREALPQLGNGMFLTDGGLETSLIYHDGFDLPDFAAFVLLGTKDGETALRRYFRSYAEIARQFDAGLILESATWRANRDWGICLDYSPTKLQEINYRSVHLLAEIRDEYEIATVLSGCIGPRGDGYAPGKMMSELAAQAYHREQIEAFAGTEADMVCAITMTYVEEAIGITQAAKQAGMPLALSFTVETDGRLPSGQSLRTAIEQVDEVTEDYPAYYMINCAHPTHFGHILSEAGPWLDRIRGLRANASRKSHMELDSSTELDAGDPVELGWQYSKIKRYLKRLSVLGGCCGTDYRHVEQIAAACAPLYNILA